MKCAPQPEARDAEPARARAGGATARGLSEQTPAESV